MANTAEISLVVGGKEFTDLVKGMDLVGERLDAAFTRGVMEVPQMLITSLNKVARKLAQQHGGAWNGSVFNSSNNLQSRTGQGLKSILNSVKLLEKGGSLVSASISAGTLSIHETGGTVKATRSQYLTIPLPAAMDNRGVPLKRRAREWTNTFVKRSRKGNLIIFRKLPGARELLPLYILKTSVYIKPRLGMEPAIGDEMGYFDSKLFERISDLIDQFA